VSVDDVVAVSVDDVVAVSVDDVVAVSVDDDELLESLDDRLPESDDDVEPESTDGAAGISMVGSTGAGSGWAAAPASRRPSPSMPIAVLTATAPATIRVLAFTDETPALGYSSFRRRQDRLLSTSSHGGSPL